MTLRIAVVGAGSSGLVCLKELRAEGHDAVAFEAGPAIGGMFQSRRNGGLAYDSMRLTSSNFVTAFSDLPPADARPRHWRHEEYIAYLRRYAARFTLADHIRLSTAVRALEPDGGGWRVEVEGPDGRASLRFDAVAVCTGIAQRPHRPVLPGQADFAGQIVHSADYLTAAPFAGRDVVVIGGGETSGDVVNEISAVSASCAVSLRRGLWIIPRRVRGVPNDFHTSRVLHGLPRTLLDRLSLARARLYDVGGRLPGADRVLAPSLVLRARLLLASGRGVFSQYAVKTEAMIHPVLDDRVTLRPGVRRLERDGVVFTDGTRVRADAIVLCTGYRFRLPFAEQSGTAVEGLYRRCLDPAHGGRLAFIGFARPAIGAIPPLAEMQARWFARVCSGAIPLPDPAAMRAEAAAERRRALDRYGPLAERLATLVDYTTYLDTLAGDIGCKPDLVRTLTDDPELAWWLFVRPLIGAQYRLIGPHAEPALARRVLGLAAPVIDPYFLAFLLGCHGATRLLSAVGVDALRPPLSLRVRRGPGRRAGGDGSGLGRRSDRVTR